MFVRPSSARIPAIVLAAFVSSLLTGCLGDSESAKKRLLEQGKKYYDTGKFKEASIIYKRVLQKDQRYGEAYYLLGLSELKQGRYGDAVKWLRRASELQTDNDDAHAKLGDLYLTIYLNDRNKYKQLLVDFQELSERLLKKNPKHFEGLRMRGYLAVANENWKEAISYFEQANQVKPGQGHVLLALAQAMVADKQAEAGEKLIVEAIAKNKNYGPMYDFLYAAHVARKDIPGAEDILRQKADNNPTSAAYVLELAGHHFRAKDETKMGAALGRLTSNLKQFPEAHRMVGDFYFRIQKFDQALKAYEEGMKAQPDQRANFLKKQVELLAIQGKRPEAISLAQKVVDEFKDDAEGKALRASLRLQSGDPKEIDAAISEFQSVLNKMSDNPVVRFNLGEAYMAKADIDNARIQFTEAIKIRPSYVPPKLALGRIHLAKQEFPRAQQLADEILQLNQGFVPGRLLRIQALMGMQENKTARAELKTLQERIPNLREPYYMIAMLDMTERNFADAEKGFLTLAKSTPPDPRGTMGLVEIYAQTNRGAQAKQLLEDELKKNPPNAQTLKLALANLAVKMGKNDEAVSQYQSLIQQYPTAAPLYLNLGRTLFASNKLPEAEQAFQKAQELAPNDVSPLVNLAMVKQRNGTASSDLKPLYEKILKLAPDNYIALNNLAYMLAESGSDLDQALTYAQKAKQQMPNNDDVADTLGWIYIKKNLSDDAIKIFRQLLTKNPQHVTWRYHLAMALFAKGDKLQAKKELEAAMRNKPNNDESQKITALMSRIG